MRFVLLIIVIFAVLLLVRKLQAPRKRVSPRPSATDAERMVACAHCGVNQPVSECVVSHGLYYCSNTHQQAAEARSD